MTRIGTARAYFVDRASRIYSVVLPCLLLTFLLAAVAWKINPQPFPESVGNFEWARIPQQLISNLTFTSQLWGYEISPPSNGPFWSISFEVLYYAIYGLVFYSVRRRWFWVALLLLIAGPSIVFNAAFWLLGCLTYDLFARFKSHRQVPLYASACLAAMLLLLAVLRHPLARLIHATDRPQRMAWMTRTVPLPHLFYEGQIPWLSRISSSFVVSSILTAAFMLWALLLLNRFMPNVPRRVVKAVRIVANSTFTLYLLHLPLLMLISVLIGHPVHSQLGIVAIPAAIITLCVVISIPLDQFMYWIRKSLPTASALTYPSDRSHTSFDPAYPDDPRPTEDRAGNHMSRN